MGKDARKYTQKTLKRLYGLSGNICAFPGCHKKLVNKNNAKNSNICHIEAGNPGGERYNPKMTDKQRADYDNLILFCVQHHEETNNVDKYSVETLKKMKREHESDQLNEKLTKNPSMLLNTISAISSLNLGDIKEVENLNIFNPKEKLYFNNLKRNLMN